MPNQIVRTRKARVLVVDDDHDLAAFLVDMLSSFGHDATAQHNTADAQRAIEEAAPDLLVTDVCMAGADGIELVGWTRRFDPRVAIIAITAFGSIDTAVRAIRAGAFDFITKPFEPQTFRLAVDRALETTLLRSEVRRLRNELGARFGVGGLVGRSQALGDIVALVQRVADSQATVLITGPPRGSGKELIARALHTESKRSGARFVAVNCAAIPDTLLESELFGYRKGAFTDARADRMGLFQEADKGTLFLDEIGDLPLALQAKILRVLQEREVRPLGALRGEPVDVRVVAATHRDLRKAVAEGRFREDLFYRLAVIEIGVPPLRDRPEDILPLAEHFLKQANLRADRPIKGFSGAAMKRLEAYALARQRARARKRRRARRGPRPRCVHHPRRPAAHPRRCARARLPLLRRRAGDDPRRAQHGVPPTRARSHGQQQEAHRAHPRRRPPHRAALARREARPRRRIRRLNPSPQRRRDAAPEGPRGASHPARSTALQRRRTLRRSAAPCVRFA
jgi:DNA-binding NtrC family response regulator